MIVWHVNVADGLGRVDGVVTASTRLAEAQAALGHEAHLFAVGDAAGGGQGRPDHAAAGLWRQTASTSGDVVRRFGQLLADPTTRPDIVHFHSVFRPAHARMARVLTRLGVPYVASAHSGLSGPSLRRYPVRKAVYGELVERRLFRNAAGVACLTVTEAADVRAYCRRGDLRTWVVPNGLEAAAFEGPAWSGLPRGRPTVLTLARYDVRQKGLDVLADIARACPDVDFVVHGEQDKNEPTRTRALLAATPGNLAFRTPVHGTEKYRLLAGAALFVQPSRWEGQSVALAEAMAAGVPTAVSAYVGDSLEFDRHQLGLVLDRDPLRAADQLRRALCDPDRLRAWSEAGRAYARDQYRSDDVARRQLEAYQQVLDRTRMPTAS